MKLNRSMVTVIAGISLLVLTGCTSGEKKASETTESSPVAAAPAEPTAADAEASSSSSSEGGQVVESGPYHLELVPGSEAEGTHLDLFLQKGDTHEAISDAKITAQVDLPDGTQQSLEMEYDAEGKHYTALIPGSAAGDYKVAVLSDIAGEKVNGRFSFSK
jgi:hypothetical protein